MTVTPIESLEQFHALIKSGKPVLIDFWATWCGPCRAISPIFEKLSENKTDIGFYKVDVDTQADISQELKIRAMPTFMLFKDGEKVKELVGANPQGLNELVSHAASLV